MTPRRPNSSARQALTPNARQAFTLLEVLIAISVIVILVGILFISFKSVGNSAKAKQTVINFEILKTMLDQARQVDTNLLNQSGILPAPGGINDPATRDRADRNQVLYTRYIMARLMRVPEVKKSVEQLQTSQLLGRTPLDTAPAFNSNTTYYVSDRVSNAGVDYLCVAYVKVADLPPPENGYTPNQLPSYFLPENPSAAGDWTNAPVLLDGWGNPILAVPNRGLMHARTSKEVIQTAWNGSGVNYAGGAVVSATVDAPNSGFAQNFKAISSSLSSTSPYNGPIEPDWAASVTAPNNRPFFVSAGPDGIVGYVNGTVKGADDNVYSFEN